MHQPHDRTYRDTLLYPHLPICRRLIHVEDRMKTRNHGNHISPVVHNRSSTRAFSKIGRNLHAVGKGIAGFLDKSTRNHPVRVHVRISCRISQGMHVLSYSKITSHWHRHQAIASGINLEESQISTPAITKNGRYGISFRLLLPQKVSYPANPSVP